jgi:transcriptional regulator with XRE-family HTH domain
LSILFGKFVNLEVKHLLVKKIQELCRRNNTNFAQLERALGFSNGMLQKWDRSVPGLDKVQAVADYFKISIDELLDRGIFKFSDEAQLIAAQYDGLPSEKRDLIRCYIGVIKAG